MSGFTPALRRFSRAYRRRENASRTSILDLQRRIKVLEEIIGRGSTSNRAIYSQMELVHARCTAVVGSPSSGIYTFVPLEFNASSAWVDDTEDATPINVMAGPASIPFVGARCWVMLIAVHDGVGHWITVNGECNGFRAKLTSAVDGSHTYQWTQVDNAPGTAALTHATGTLGRCKDAASGAYSGDVTARIAIPTNTEVTLHWNYTAAQFQFVFSPEQDVEDC